MSPRSSRLWRSLLGIGEGRGGREGRRGGGVRGEVRGDRGERSSHVLISSRLFHIVVDTDRTASQILSTMNRNKMGGEVTFLPLNKLQPSNPHYPNTKVSRITKLLSGCGRADNNHTLLPPLPLPGCYPHGATPQVQPHLPASHHASLWEDSDM